MTIWEKYGTQIQDMRQGGATLQEIGDSFGVTRERIRQVLVTHYGSTKNPFIKASEASALIGCSKNALLRMRQEGKFVPRKIGQHHYYQQEDINIIRDMLQRYCKGCGTLLGHEDGTRYCAGCRAKYGRYVYHKFSSPEAKKRATARARLWQKNNPERFKEICKTSTRRWCAKHPEKVAEIARKRRQNHFNNTTYQVFRGDELPIGSIVKAVGCENNRLVLDNGVKIPFGIVRKL